MNNDRNRIFGRSKKKSNLRSKLMLFSSPIVSLSPIKEEPGPNNHMGVLSASCHGAFFDVNSFRNKNQVLLNSGSSSNLQDDSGVFEDFDEEDKLNDYYPIMKNGQVMDIGQASKTAILLPTSSFTSPSKSVTRSRPEHHYCSKSADHTVWTFDEKTGRNLKSVLDGEFASCKKF